MQRPSKHREAPPAYATIVSRNPDTLDGLQQYLGRAGIPSRTTAALRDLDVVAPAYATVAVIFPDEFSDEAVLSAVARLRRKRPRLLTLLITRAPTRLRCSLSSSDDDRLPMPTILPKPLFGWQILDAIRAHHTEIQA
jgi:hypothetical protein